MVTVIDLAAGAFALSVVSLVATLWAIQKTCKMQLTLQRKIDADRLRQAENARKAYERYVVPNLERPQYDRKASVITLVQKDSN